MDDWLVSVVKDGKVVELYYSDNLCEIGTIRAMHDGCDVEVMKIKESVSTKKDVDFASEITAGRRGKLWAMNVKCIETGETWSSVIECSKATGINSWSLYKSVHKGYAVGGYHFEAVLRNKE